MLRALLFMREARRSHDALAARKLRALACEFRRLAADLGPLRERFAPLGS